MDEKDFLIQKLEKQLKEEKERNEKLLDKIKELTMSNVKLYEQLLGH